MRIGIIGAGNVGGTLGRAWARIGHEVCFGVPQPDRADMRQLVDAIGPTRASARAPRAAAQASDVVVLATPWPVTLEAVRGFGPLAGKLVIDCTNPLTSGPDGMALELGHTTSGAERIAATIPGVAVFKALNQVGFDVMADPRFPAGAAVMFVAGDDAAGKPTVLKLVSELGFDAVDVGGLKLARLLEPWAMLWIHLALNRGLGRSYAFVRARR
jgi:predicted dinucleotide-binding enzyme